MRLMTMIVSALLLPQSAHAFCGFFVSKAGASMFNEASQVVLVRDGQKTAITMVNDFKGDPQDFAMVIPVPTFIEREQINVGEMAVVDHLDAYTAPRLVEYHDPNPCEPAPRYRKFGVSATEDGEANREMDRGRSASALGVKVEASYSVGEYDIQILSATKSQGLVTWLDRNGYRTPNGAEPVVKSYMRQGMRFFVAKVNVGNQKRLGFTKLRPIQVAYESPKFMLPIRLGMVNSRGQQELIVYALTRSGRVESTNYRTVKLPSDVELPLFVRDEFEKFYVDMFRHQTNKHQSRVLFTEYAWDMSWCDPCAANPLSTEELRSLGVFWADRSSRAAPKVFVTRLHVRYDAKHFPADLAFHETGDRTNFQGRYILRNPARGDLSCSAGQDYKRELGDRWARDAATMASLTGWSLADVRKRIDWTKATVDQTDKPWWKSIWK